MGFGAPAHLPIARPRNGIPPMADANEPLAYETIETPATAAAKGFDWIQLGFWSALVIAGGAAGMALTWQDAVGPSGAVLVIASLFQFRTDNRIARSITRLW